MSGVGKSWGGIKNALRVIRQSGPHPAMSKLNAVAPTPQIAAMSEAQLNQGLQAFDRFAATASSLPEDHQLRLYSEYSGLFGGSQREAAQAFEKLRMNLSSFPAPMRHALLTSAAQVAGVGDSSFE